MAISITHSRPHKIHWDHPMAGYALFVAAPTKVIDLPCAQWRGPDLFPTRIIKTPLAFVLSCRNRRSVAYLSFTLI